MTVLYFHSLLYNNTHFTIYIYTYIYLNSTAAAQQYPKVGGVHTSDIVKIIARNLVTSKQRISISSKKDGTQDNYRAEEADQEEEDLEQVTE